MSHAWKFKFKSPLQNKKSTQVFIGLILFCVGIVLAAWLVFGGIESTDDAQVEGHIVHVASRIPGHVVKIMVDDNQLVQKGDSLVELDNTLQKANVELAQAELEEASAGFRQAIVSVKQTHSIFVAAQSAEQLQRKNMERVQNLKKQNAISQQAVDQQKEAYDQAAANLESSRSVFSMPTSQYHLLEKNYSNGPSNEFWAIAEKIKGVNPALDGALAKLKKAQANLNVANLNLSYTVIYAPFAGVTANKSVEIGRNVSPEVPLISVVSLTDTWIVANFKEDQLRHLKAQQNVDIKLDMYGNKVFKGRVSSIAPASGESFSLLPPDNASGNFVKVTQRFPVRIDFVTHDHNVVIRPGLSAVATVKLNTKN